MFFLNNELPLVRELKKAHFLLTLDELRFVKRFLESNGGTVSLAVFGSYAEGTQDEGSDVDFLVIKRGAPASVPSGSSRSTWGGRSS